MAKADLKKKVVLDIPTTEEEKKKALQSAIAHITKVYGTGAIMRLGENKANLNVEAIPTGSMMLDMALGIGGVPRGRIVELYGPESSGKTTVALHIIAEAQKMGGEVAFIDVEHALDPTYAEALGVNIDSLLVSSRTAVSRRWKSPRRWCAPVPSTCWSWTLWQPSPPRRRSTAKWVTATWDSWRD